MTAVEQAQEMIQRLTRSEKAQILQWVARDVGEDFPGIESTPGVCGGDPCIVRTRIPVWLLEDMRRSGASESVMLDAYPNLRAADLVNAWAYVRAHQEEIDRQIEENENA